MIDIALPYVYVVKNITTGEFYYGSRYKNVAHGRTSYDDFWKIYFTSSNKIKSLIKIYGKDSFEYKIILEDISYDTCYWTEQSLIKENISDPLCLNIHYVDKNSNNRMFSTAGNKDVANKISAYRKANPLTPAQQNIVKNMVISNTGKTYEDICGEEKAANRRKKASINRKNQLINNPIRGDNNPNAKTYNAVSPDGQIYVISGKMAEFCKEHGLNWGMVIKLAKGRIDYYKGWNIIYSA